MLGKTTVKIIGVIALIAGLNFVYNATFFEKDFRTISPHILKLQQTCSKTDVYYFGESSNTTFRENDSVKTPISDLAALFYPGLRFVNINKEATHAGIYRYWLRSLDGYDTLPKAVVITLNLRSFDAAWRHSKLETPLQESLIMGSPLPNIINRFMLSLQAFDNKSEKQREEEMLKEWKTTPLNFPFDVKYKTVREWDDAMANGGHKKPDGTWDTEKCVLACHYIKGYAFNLDENNQRIKDFDAISKWCEVRKVKLYLNLMAENVQYADSLVGKELVFLMRQNRDFLVKRYNTHNCVVVDNLEAVPGYDFIDQNWTTEHYGFRGRMTIAAKLAEAMKKQFYNEYKKAY